MSHGFPDKYHCRSWRRCAASRAPRIRTRRAGRRARRCAHLPVASRAAPRIFLRPRRAGRRARRCAHLPVASRAAPRIFLRPRRAGRRVAFRQ
jgi:hypothetical protein